jgi:hypothetical protein
MCPAMMGWRSLQLLADTLHRRIETEAGFNARHHQIHHVRKAKGTLALPGGDEMIDIEGRRHQPDDQQARH